ncbi:MAG: hypothetical protein JXR85_09450 [Deltaproteobacteria bacterium]|nr:hypothetical protein [Deltaproteobacteria bacterium]
MIEITGTQQKFMTVEDITIRLFDRYVLARAMVKTPPSLILGDFREGFDRTNRGMVLRLLDDIGTATGKHLLYVTHREDDIPRCVRHRLAFEAASGDHYRVRCSAV